MRGTILADWPEFSIISSRLNLMPLSQRFTAHKGKKVLATIIQAHLL
jgi:hypothetical protein